MGGTGGTMGYVELSQVAGRLEGCAANGDAAACEQQMQSLERLIARIPCEA